VITLIGKLPARVSTFPGNRPEMFVLSASAGYVFIPVNGWRLSMSSDNKALVLPYCFFQTLKFFQNGKDVNTH